MHKLFLVSLPLLAGCPLLELQAEVAEVCVTYRDVQIEGVTGDRVQHSFTVDDLGELNALVEQDAELAFTRATIRAHGSAFPRVDAASVSVASGDPDSALPTLSIVECAGDCAPDNTTLTIPAATQHSAVEYVKTGSLVIDLDLQGQLPADAWTADVDVCMTGHFTYTLEP